MDCVFQEMEFLQDKNDKDKRDLLPKVKSPEISCSQQSEMISPENSYSSSILVDRSSDLEPPAAKKAKKRVSFNLPEDDPLNIRRSERIFLSTSSPDNSDVIAQTEDVGPMETENCVPVPIDISTSSNFHKRNTTKTPGFHCTCGIQYTSKGKLVDHVRKHSLGMRFQCVECNKKFYHGYLYRRHIRRTHGVKTLIAEFGCGLCGVNFEGRGQLFKHQKIAQ